MKTQAPSLYRFGLGDFGITVLSDGTVPQDLYTLLTNTNPGKIDSLLHRNFLANPVETSINVFLIDTGDHRVLVDTGAGELFGSKLGGRLQASLKAAGCAPDEIDMVLLTHIHTDHSGGLVENGQLMFPRATVYVGQPDVDFWLDRANAEVAQANRRKSFYGAIKTVEPYLAAGKLKPFSGETVILPGITSLPTPGHTPGHSCYHVESQGESVEFWGDMLHVASVQLLHPAIAIIYDVDPDAAASQRVKQLANAEKTRCLVAGAHLPFPGLGHIRAEDQGYAWVPMNYSWREP
ncbi:MULTISPECIES: MBL fold metallo-hydrolase [unclassified Nostoc]|uniref:MBL fold metallo-hydrolase n=1 Tax=unclassified Nostoc TaxID=2593658 RepID=UPI002AD6CF9E|nr:MBL fold metallo-hydrolase [Nostoc sp. DedQUE02]